MSIHTKLVALVIRAKKQKHLNVHQQRNGTTNYGIFIQWKLFSHKKKWILKHITTVKNTLLSERSQHKGSYIVLFHLYKTWRMCKYTDGKLNSDCQGMGAEG